MKLNDLDRRGQVVVRAKCRIEDSPLAEIDASAQKGAVGSVEDIDYLSGVAFVDFGGGAIACYPEELKMVRLQ